MRGAESVWETGKLHLRQSNLASTDSLLPSPQLASFEHPLQFEGIRTPEKPFNAVFIRAPIVHHILSSENSQDALRILASVPVEKLPKSKTTPIELGPDAHAVALQQGRRLVTSFHPELSTDPRIHEYFLQDLVLPSLSA